LTLMIPRINLPLNAETPLAMSRVPASVKAFDRATEVSKLYTSYISLQASTKRNPLRVAEAVHESSARIAKSYPATPIAFPGGERITPIIYVGGELAELNMVRRQKCCDWEDSPLCTRSRSIRAAPPLPLREIVRFAQGIALLKINAGFSCNSREV